ncbi:MAG: glucokinase [Polyangiales bacterium]
MVDPVLAGDVGGTKTLLRLCGPGGASLLQRRFESAKQASLTAMVRAFLDEAARAGHPRPRIAAFGVAGPVVDGVSKTTNLPWRLDEGDIAGACGLTAVRLMNDFEATAYGVLDLPAASLSTLQLGEPARGGNVAVIGAGTGLGEALLVPIRDRSTGAIASWHVVATEGGHADFAPRDDLEIELLRWLRTRHGHVSWERVVSGQGIVNVYSFLRDTGVVKESAAVAAELAAGDPGAVIGAHALAGTDALCMKTIDVFVAAYGSEAGNLALKGLATGGVYLTGGIAPKLLAKLGDGAFLRSYRDKGRLSSVVERAPVHVVLDQEVPLRGAAYVAARMASGAG